MVYKQNSNSTYIHLYNSSTIDFKFIIKLNKFNMNTNELSERINIRFKASGMYEVVIDFNQKKYHCITVNRNAIDRIRSEFVGTKKLRTFETKKSAYLSLWNECKKANNLI